MNNYYDYLKKYIFYNEKEKKSFKCFIDRPLHRTGHNIGTFVF